MNEQIINLENLSIGYKGREPLLKPINASVETGEFICLIGENGKGKSTLLKTLTAGIRPISGAISIFSQLLDKYSNKELSALISVVFTEPIQLGLIKVFDLVSFGRYPYTNWLANLEEDDKSIIYKSIKNCDIEHLTNRYFSNLSDGEKQKVLISRALAQNTPIIVLDEPLNHLDLINRAEIFSLLKRLSREQKKTIIISSHQIELVLQVADKIWLLEEKDFIAVTPKEAIEGGLFERVFISDKVKFDSKSKTFKLTTI